MKIRDNLIKVNEVKPLCEGKESGSMCTDTGFLKTQFWNLPMKKGEACIMKMLTKRVCIFWPVLLLSDSVKHDSHWKQVTGLMFSEAGYKYFTVDNVGVIILVKANGPGSYHTLPSNQHLVRPWNKTRVPNVLAREETQRVRTSPKILLHHTVLVEELSCQTRVRLAGL